MLFIKCDLGGDFKTEKYKIITADCGGPLTFKTNKKLNRRDKKHSL